MASNLNDDLNRDKLKRFQANRHNPSRFLNALHRFTVSFATEVRNPMRDKYGKAYEFLIAGDACRYREEMDAAIENYRQALINNPLFSEAYLGMAKCLRREGDLKGAIRCLTHAVERNAFHVESHLDLAKCLTEAGFSKRARHHYERVLRLDVRNVDAHFGLALLYETEGELEKSIQLYQNLMTLDSEFLPAYNNLGSLYLRIHSLDLAEQLFSELVAKAPDFTRGYLGLAMTLDRAGKCARAIEAYETVMRLRPDGKNNEFIKQRLVQMRLDLGHSKTRHNTTLVRLK